MKKTHLEVGDIVYLTDRWSRISKLAITSVSPKRAKAGSSEFLREIKWHLDGTNWVSGYGDTRNGSLPTPELDAKFENQKLASKYICAVEKTLKNTPTNSQMERIISILNETT